MLISEASPTDVGAAELLARLSETLASITGDSGQGSFDVSDLESERAVFVVGREGDRRVGCGALRPFDEDSAELKRMFALPGKGAELLAYLERAAMKFMYRRIVLSTRRVNQRAVQFYLKHGYQVTENYGRYSGRPESVCLTKDLPRLSE